MYAGKLLNQFKTDFDFAIGFDADVKENGIAVLNVEEGKVERVQKINLFKIEGFVRELVERSVEKNPSRVLVVLEDASASSATFGAFEQFSTLQRKNGSRSAFSIVAKRIEKTGRNKQTARYIHELCETIGTKVLTVPPEERRKFDRKPLLRATPDSIRRSVIASLNSGRLLLPSKMDSGRFKVLLNWNRRTNEDERDAGLLLLPFLEILKKTA